MRKLIDRSIIIIIMGRGCGIVCPLLRILALAPALFFVFSSSSSPFFFSFFNLSSFISRGWGGWWGLGPLVLQNVINSLVALNGHKPWTLKPLTVFGNINILILIFIPGIFLITIFNLILKTIVSFQLYFLFYIENQTIPNPAAPPARPQKK